MAHPAVNDKCVAVGRHARNASRGKMKLLDVKAVKVLAAARGPAAINEGRICCDLRTK